MLCSCSLIDSGKVAAGYVEAIKAVNQYYFGYEENLITPELIKQIPYASSVMKIGKGPKGLIILESVNKDNLTWVSADGVYLVIRNGKIIKTSGLNNNLIKIVSTLNLSDSLKEENKITYVNYYSFDKPYLRNMRVETRVKNKGKKLVQLINKEIELTEFEEQISNDYIGWKVKNIYWADDDYYIWKSKQYISPKVPPIFLEVTKKPSS